MLILASMSPRRREILALAGFEFTVHPADIDESVPDGTPADSAVIMTAQKKAEAVLPYASEEDVILAMGAGKKAAAGIHEYLQNK